MIVNARCVGNANARERARHAGHHDPLGSAAVMATILCRKNASRRCNTSTLQAMPKSTNATITFASTAITTAFVSCPVTGNVELLEAMICAYGRQGGLAEVPPKISWPAL